MLNIPALEAQESLRLVMTLGAVMGGNEGGAEDYMNALAESAYYDTPDLREAFHEKIAVADRLRGKSRTSPTPSSDTPQQWADALKP